MSFDHIKMVRAISGLSATQKLILFDLAGRADDFGRCWPSIATIMQDTSIGNRRTVWTNLSILHDKGLIHIAKADGRHNEYFMTLENGLKPDVKNDQSATPGVGAKEHPVQKNTGCQITPGVGAKEHPHQVQNSTPKIPRSIQEESNSFVNSVGDDKTTPQKTTPKTKTDDCPYQEIVALYHETLPASPRIKLLGKTRASGIKARWNGEVVDRLKVLGKGASREDRLLFLKSFFEQAAASDFLTGKKAFRDGSVYFVTLEKLMSPTGFLKLIEGEYDNRGVA